MGRSKKKIFNDIEEITYSTTYFGKYTDYVDEIFFRGLKITKIYSIGIKVKEEILPSKYVRNRTFFIGLDEYFNLIPNNIKIIDEYVLKIIKEKLPVAKRKLQIELLIMKIKGDEVEKKKTKFQFFLDEIKTMFNIFFK